MDFNFSAEQEQIRDAVRGWISKRYDFQRRQNILATGGYSKEAYGELAELGLTALYIPEQYGGMGMGPVESMIAMEELGRGIVLEPLTQTLITSLTLATYASESVQEKYLPSIASGTQLVVLAHQESRNRYQLDSCTNIASGTDKTGYSISGVKSIVPAGNHADAFLVPALLDNDIALFLVERTSPGVSTQSYRVQDGSCAAELVCNTTPALLITREGRRASEHALDIGIAAVCAEAVGVMDKALEITADYLNTRKQFGVVIATFQALRHRLADMKMQLELARSMSYYATLKLNSPSTERRQAISRAKYQLGCSMRMIGQQAVQLHGGIGMTDEYVVSHYFRKLTQLELTFGDTLHHLAEVSEHMQDTASVL